MDGQILNMKVQTDLYNAMKEEASKKHISLAALVRIALSEYLEKVKRQGTFEPRIGTEEDYRSLSSYWDELRKVQAKMRNAYDESEEVRNRCRQYVDELKSKPCNW